MSDDDPKPGFLRKPIRYITKKCLACGTITSGLLHTVNVPNEQPTQHERTFGQERTPGGPFPFRQWALPQDIVLTCRGCGKQVSAKAIHGIVKRDVACNAKCMASKGNSCECACGGKNHGASYDAAR